MPDSSDLLRDAEVLRKLLTECLRRIDRLESQLRTEALEREGEPAPPLTDPFERALPDDGGQLGDGVPAPPSRPRPKASDAGPSSAIRTLHVSPTQSQISDDGSKPRSEMPSPRSTAAHPSNAPRTSDEDAPPPSGDGSLDPFALLDLAVPPTESLEAEISRGMNALLGGLDVTTSGDDD